MFQEAFGAVLRKLDSSQQPILGQDDVRAWPEGALAALIRCGILQDATAHPLQGRRVSMRGLAEALARALSEKWCSEGVRELVEDRLYYLGSERASPDRRESKKVNVDELAKKLAKDVPGFLVMADVAAQVAAGKHRQSSSSPEANTLLNPRRELFLARGLTWPDAAEMLYGAATFKESRMPIVVVPSAVPTPGLWKGSVPREGRLTALATFDEGGLKLDLSGIGQESMDIAWQREQLRSYEHMADCERRLADAVEQADLVAVLEVLIDDLQSWGRRVRGYAAQCADECSGDRPPLWATRGGNDAGFRPYWIWRSFVGATHAFEMLQFQKGAEYAQLFRQKFARFDQARNDLIQMFIAHDGTVPDAEHALYLMRTEEQAKDLSAMAFSLADYVYSLSRQVDRLVRGPQKEVKRGGGDEVEGAAPDTDQRPANSKLVRNTSNGSEAKQRMSILLAEGLERWVAKIGHHYYRLGKILWGTHYAELCEALGGEQMADDAWTGGWVEDAAAWLACHKSPQLAEGLHKRFDDLFAQAKAFDDWVLPHAQELENQLDELRADFKRGDMTEEEENDKRMLLLSEYDQVTVSDEAGKLKSAALSLARYLQGLGQWISEAPATGTGDSGAEQEAGYTHGGGCIEETPPAGTPARSLAELASLIRHMARVVAKEGDSERAGDLMAQAHESFRKLAPILELAVGHTLAEEILRDTRFRILNFVAVDGGELGGSAVFWGGSDGKAEALARQLEEWHVRANLVRAGGIASGREETGEPLPAGQTGIVRGTGDKGEQPKRARTAEEAVALLKDEWATYEQLANVTGKTAAAIRSSLHRAKKRGELLLQDTECIPESRSRAPRIRLRIRGVWRFLSIQ